VTSAERSRTPASRSNDGLCVLQRSVIPKAVTNFPIGMIRDRGGCRKDVARDQGRMARVRRFEI
jgi:hypothetical protein